MVIHVKCEQGEPEWFEARAGVITASMFGEARKKLKSGKEKGEPTKAARDYAFKLAIERISGELLDDPEFDSWQARRGRELEPEARMKYESRTKTLVEQVGLALTDDRKFGCSLDGIISDKKTLEIKCFLSPSKIKNIILNRDIGECIDQVQGGLWITGAEYCDFVLYCPALKSIAKEMTIITIERDNDYIEKLELDLLEFESLVNNYVEQIKK